MNVTMKMTSCDPEFPKNVESQTVLAQCKSMHNNREKITVAGIPNTTVRNLSQAQGCGNFRSKCKLTVPWYFP